MNSCYYVAIALFFVGILVGIMLESRARKHFFEKDDEDGDR